MDERRRQRRWEEEHLTDEEWAARHSPSPGLIAWVVFGFVLVVLFLLVVLVRTADAKEGPCRSIDEDRIPALIKCVAERWDVGKERSLDVARCESNLNPRAVNGRFAGLYQIGDTEWESWRRPQHYRRWFPNDPGRFHARAHTITAVFHAARSGWGAWTCA